jgi:glucose/arabinose dehydrogenase
MRAFLLIVLTLTAAVFSGAGCPRPNGYTTVSAIPQATYDDMVGLHWIPGAGSYAVVLTKEGLIWRVNTAEPREAPTLFLDLRDRMLQNPTTEEGLLGLAFAPDFASSGRLYTHYTAPGDVPVHPGGIPRKSVIARFTSDSVTADPSSHRSILEVRQPYSNHNGGALAFGPDGYLYASFGDGGSGGDPEGYAQRLDTLLGKILRLDVSGDSYTIPPDNPFVDVAGARGEIWAYGFRNPWRLSFDRETGWLWTGDVGQNQLEEVDLVMSGGNYGWNILEGSDCYNAPSCEDRGTLYPVAEYTHEFGCSITGGYVYRGDAMPELQGWYVYGDYCSGRIWAVNADARQTTGGQAPHELAVIPLADTNAAIASFAEGPQDELHIVTFGRGIQRLVRQEP